MTANQSFIRDVPDNLDDKLSTGAASQKPNVLASKVSSVLSASYADSEIRDALRFLDDRNIENKPETRRRIRLDLQKEVIERNGNIIKDFGRVAEVRSSVSVSQDYLN